MILFFSGEMFSATVVRSAHCLRPHITSQFKRNIGVSAALSQAATTQNPPDLIQQLFVSKVREYAQKSKAAGGKLVGADPVAEASLKQEMEKLATQFGAKGQDFTKFPTFEFKDTPLDKVYSDGHFLEMFQETETELQELKEEEEDDDDRPFFEKYY